IPAATLQEFIAYAKANPGKVAYGSGLGTPPHVIGEWLKAKAGIDIVYLPHRGGGPALNDLLGGHTQLGIEIMHPLLPYIQEGKLKPLAVTSAARRRELPNVPTLFGERISRADISRLVRPRGAGRHPAADRRDAKRGDQR